MGAEGEGERKSEADSLLIMEPDSGFDTMILRSRPEPKPSQSLN